MLSSRLWAYKHVIISEGRSIGEEESEYESQHTTNIIIFNINKKRVIKDRGKRLPIPGKYGIKAGEDCIVYSVIMMMNLHMRRRRGRRYRRCSNEDEEDLIMHGIDYEDEGEDEKMVQDIISK
ncbi:6320_t:CDS:2 [Entrophospora sp. SA101]|nr:4472_t:CDS:2 [Entrophospora sp. SA101]CAJ0879285.1 6320_t:CDS:2 [Entrophospora sp. SA101]